jgi:16S rRNA (cytosine1402-N4)-methyltransferase
MEGTRHLPVLVTEVLTHLACQSDRVYIDGTVGSGGHAKAILESSSPNGRLIGLDLDEEAIERAKKNLTSFGGRVELLAKNFRDVREVMNDFSLKGVDGILLDLGISTDQLEDQTRGFSFRWNGQLDMRMSQQMKTTARELLQKLPAEELSRILREFGEERFANRIAKAIVRRRQAEPLRNTRDLVEVIERSIPYSRGRIHPATRSFQALRIAVNEELQNLDVFLTQCPRALNPGGRLCIISFHSLEDRMVKNYFRLWSKRKKGETAPFRLLTPKPVVPSQEEILTNPKARSAKLRAIEKLSETMEGGNHGGSHL